MNESDLHEPEYNAVKRRSVDFTNQHMTNAFDYVQSLSKIWEQNNKVKDLLKIKKDSKLKHSTTESIISRSGSNVSYSSSYADEERRRSSLSGLNPNSNQNVVSFLKVREILSTVNNFDFNIFSLNELLNNRTLIFMASEIFASFNFFDSILKESTFNNFIKNILEGYSRKVLYHNDLHAADTMQTLFVMIEKGQLDINIQLKPIDTFSLLIAAICHDYKHPWLTNNFQINDKSVIALSYNGKYIFLKIINFIDSSVLENYHVAEAFKTIVLKEENNIFEYFSPEEYRVARRRVIACILATDMSNHTRLNSSLKDKLETFNIKQGKHLDRLIFDDDISKTFDNQQSVLNVAIHCADVSNPAKQFDVYTQWVDLLFKEFFAQGDLEKNKGYDVSLLCDRDTTNIDKSQIGFIGFAVLPTFELLVNIIPGIKVYIDTVKSNLKKYEEIVEKKLKEWLFLFILFFKYFFKIINYNNI